MLYTDSSAFYLTNFNRLDINSSSPAFVSRQHTVMHEFAAESLLITKTGGISLFILMLRSISKNLSNLNTIIYIQYTDNDTIHYEL